MRLVLVEAVIVFAALTAALGQSDPLSGGAGWVGAGLLGLVLGWLLLKHLPDKDRQQTELLQSRDHHMTDQLNAERQTCQERHAELLTEIKEQGALLRSLHEQAAARMERALDGQKDVRHAIYNLTQQVINWTLVAKHVMGIPVDAVSPKVVPEPFKLNPDPPPEP